MAEKFPISAEKTDIHSWERNKEFVLLLHGGFLLIGVVTTLLGPILPLLAAKWSLDDAELGLLFTAQFGGAIIGAAMSSRMIVRLGLLRLMVCGYVATAGAVACLGIGAWWIGLLAVFSAGLAMGLTAPAINLAVAHINPERPAAAVNILAFAWALGAVAGPPIIAFFGRNGYLAQSLIGLAVLLAWVAFLTPRRAVSDFSSPDYETPGGNDQTRLEPSAVRTWASAYGLLTGVLIFIYVGTETATSGWIASYTLRLGGPINGFEFLMPSVFWGGLLIGRAAAPTILRRVSDTTLVLSGLLLAGGGLLLILVGNNLLSVTFGAGITGFGLASVFPTTFAIFANYFGSRTPRMTGLFFVIAGLGGALIPWLVGLASEGFGDLRVGILVPLLGVVIMIILQLCTIRVLARRRSSEGERDDTKVAPHARPDLVES
jgi:MFS transporter, FHS family, glucose/mannose:H+ symporter